MENNNYTIYKLNNYNISKNEDGSWNCDSYTGSIEKVLKRLEKNKGYNLRVNPNAPCVLYGDLDHVPSEDIFDSFVELLCDTYDITTEQISYTLSKKPNEFSYHWAIPSIESTPIILKQWMKKKQWDEFRTYIDPSVYTSHWFRLPNQTNEDKLIPHNIMRGQMSDFVFHYTENCIEIIRGEVAVEPSVESKPVIADADTIEVINKCLKCISAHDYDTWLQVALILKHELGENGLDILHAWSKTDYLYDAVKVAKFYNNIKTKENGLKIGSLRKLAKDENPELYKQLFSKKQPATETKPNDKDINFIIEWSTGYIATIFKNLYHESFVYSNEVLYHFNNVYWKRDDKNQSNIHNFVDEVFYNHLLMQLYKYDINCKVKDTQHATNMTHKRGFIGSLRNVGPRGKLIEDIIKKITNNDIQFDENPYLFAFENMIYDLRKNEFVTPSSCQYISLTTGYKFIEQQDDKSVGELDEIINTIFPQPELKKLYLTILSTGLDGIPLEKFVLANGSGGNGKGVLNELVQFMLGNYAYVLPVNILLGPLKTGSNPELANMNNKRLVIAREPDANLKFNCATIKEITGGSELNARLNHSNNTKVNLKLTFLLECNSKPQLNEVNDALARRILDIPFKSRFVNKDIYEELDECEKDHTFLINDFYKSLEFKNKYRQALFMILVKHYTEFNSNKRNLPITSEIRSRNNEYLAKSDEFLNWFDSAFEKTKSKSDTIALKLVYDNYTKSDFFTNMNKVQKRQNNYKNFVEKIQGNMFLKKFLTQTTKDKTYIMTNYIIKIDDNEDDDLINDLDV